MSEIFALTLYSIIEALSGVSIALGVGSSTFAVVFYFLAVRNPELFESGRIYQKTVYIVLRIAMVLILLTELATLGFYLKIGATVTELLTLDTFLFTWTLVAVLYANAILMTLHYMPMRFGPAIQATSWYTLGVITALPLVTYTYIPLVLIYLGCILILAVVFALLKEKLAPKVVVTEEVTVTIAQG